MKLDGRLLGGCDGGVYHPGDDNGGRPERPPPMATMTTAAMTATTTTTAAAMIADDERGDSTLPSSSPPPPQPPPPPPPPREPCDCGNADGGQGQPATAGSAAVPKTSAVGSSLFTIDSILAPSRSSDAAAAAAVTVASRNNVNAATAAAAAAAGFFKQPINFGHLAAAAAASGYAHSTAANFLGKSYQRDWAGSEPNFEDCHKTF